MKNFAATISTQNKASAAIPAIKSPSVATDAQLGPQTLFYQTIAVKQGQKYPVQIKGDYVFIEGITFDFATGGIEGYGNLGIKADTNQTPVYVPESYREIQLPEKFNFLEFSNNYTVGTIYVTFYAGFGRVRRDYEPRFITTSSQQLEVLPGVCGINQSLSFALPFPAATNPATQRGVIRKASYLRQMTGTTDLTLFLFSLNFTQTPSTDFTFLPVGLGPGAYIGQIRFPSFVSGATGSYAVCDVADLGINIFSNARDPNGYANGTIYGCIVANTPTTLSAGSTNFITLTVET